MPIYEYECSQCGYRFEEKQSINDLPLTDCKGCDMINSLHRLISPSVGIKFKGSGFYVNDSKATTDKK